MAAPHITGIVSILKAQDSTLTSEKIKMLFKEHVISIETDSAKTIAGSVDFESLMTQFFQDA